MRARIHLESATEWLNYSFRKAFLKSEVEDAFWIAVHDAPTHASGEVSPAHLDRPMEVFDASGTFDHEATNRLLARMMEFLR
jgi:hypothetical protein